jgi:hypothetical protein
MLRASIIESIQQAISSSTSSKSELEERDERRERVGRALPVSPGYNTGYEK